jgi:hypothetical protein
METIMKLLPLAAVLGALALGGCATFTTLFGGSTAQAATLTDAEKALTVAHLAYQGAGVALEQAAQSGALSGANATKAQTLYDKAGAALDVADQADDAANAADILAAVADAEAAISSLNTLIQK